MKRFLLAILAFVVLFVLAVGINRLIDILTY